MEKKEEATINVFSKQPLNSSLNIKWMKSMHGNEMNRNEMDGNEINAKKIFTMVLKAF